MIGPSSIWQVEEKTELAITAFLRSAINEFGIHITTGFDAAKYIEPGIYTSVEETSNVSEDHGFNGYRVALAAIVLRSHADIGRDNTYRTAREQHGELKSRVMSVIAVSDLHTLINQHAPDGIAFDKATIENITRSMDTEANYFETVIQLACNVRPVQEEED
jgi:hypothetical protein